MLLSLKTVGQCRAHRSQLVGREGREVEHLAVPNRWVSRLPQHSLQRAQHADHALDRALGPESRPQARIVYTCATAWCSIR